MRYLFVFFLLLLPTLAIAQDEGDDPYSECAAVLSSPPATKLTEMSEDGTYGKLENMLRPLILDKNCSVDQITKYMLDSGWEIHRRGLVVSETPQVSGSYTSNKVLFFCLPERGFWRLLNHCGGGASFFWLDEKITWVVFVAPIRLGG